ncbi:DnaB-like helicase C-terminal domain-containing protein (plasmid) [Borreliella tanukii]|uniref:DnaB-like helicase C-terminal domain-containing protein n=1 Tax=Borreliella tanukii TaxID=56146 RepID=UPI003AF087C7
MSLLSTIKHFLSFIICLFILRCTQGIQIYELKAQARQMKRNYNVQSIFIDYISLIAMQQNYISRFEQVSFLSRTIPCTCSRA